MCQRIQRFLIFVGFNEFAFQVKGIVIVFLFSLSSYDNQERELVVSSDIEIWSLEHIQ